MNQLEMKFKTRIGRSLTVRIKNVKKETTSAKVQEIANYIIANNLFLAGTESLTECVSAKIVSKSESVLA